jgi:hypothetical protein
MTLAVCVIAICGSIVASIAFKKTESGAARTLSFMFERAGVLQLLAVQTIIMSVLTLRIIDALSGDATIAVFSGVAGYVLGNVGKRQQYQEQESGIRTPKISTETLPGVRRY